MSQGVVQDEKLRFKRVSKALHDWNSWLFETLFVSMKVYFVAWISQMIQEKLTYYFILCNSYCHWTQLKHVGMKNYLIHC